MITQNSQATVIPFGVRRRTRPCACVADTKSHIRKFLAQTLEELGFVTCACGRAEDLAAILQAQSPDLVVLGYGIEAITMLHALAERRFGGDVLVLGPRDSEMVMAVQDVGQQLGVSMLPLLATPFASENLRHRVASLLPGEAMMSPPIDIGEALSQGWIELWYQPKISAQTLQLCGLEALVRVRHPSWGIVLPGAFIPDNSDVQLRALSDFVIDRAMKDWRGFIYQQGNPEISINLPMTFLDDTDALASLCRQMPQDPAFQGLIIEVDSVDVIRNLERARVAAGKLRVNKIAVSIDDVGLEWPTLLLGQNEFPFVEVKVDRQLIAGCADSDRMRKECRRMLGYIDRLGARSVAEGIETQADFSAVREMGFDLAQGFLFAKPMPSQKLMRTMQAWPTMTLQ